MAPSVLELLQEEKEEEEEENELCWHLMALIKTNKQTNTKKRAKSPAGLRSQTDLQALTLRTFKHDILQMVLLQRRGMECFDDPPYEREIYIRYLICFERCLISI